MFQLGLAGQDQRLSCRHLHDAGSSWYVHIVDIQLGALTLEMFGCL